MSKASKPLEDEVSWLFLLKKTLIYPCGILVFDFEVDAKILKHKKSNIVSLAHIVDILFVQQMYLPIRASNMVFGSRLPALGMSHETEL